MFLIGRKGKVIGCEIESFGAWERCRSENGDTFSHVVEERRDVPTIRQQVHEPVESFAVESFAEWRKNRPGDLWKTPEHAR